MTLPVNNAVPGAVRQLRHSLRAGGLAGAVAAYYREERFAGVRDAFAGHVQRMLKLAGLPDAGRAAGRVLALEMAVAGRMALLVELGGHELAGEHEAVGGPAPGRAAASLSASVSSWILFFSISRRR